MRYNIGDVSRVLGITTSALHFYEKEGIIDTLKEESGRRYYEKVDINRLISVKKYRAMGVPLKEIAQQFGRDGLNGEQIVARMREKKEEAERLSRQYAELAHDIERLIVLSENCMQATGVVDVRQIEGMMALKTRDGGLIPQEKKDQLIVQKWLDAMPAVSLSILNEQTGEQAGFALMLSAQRAGEYGFEADGRVVHSIRGGMALHAVVYCGEEQYEQPEVIFQPIVNFAREHRFEQKGAMFGNVLFVDCSGGVRKYFYDTYMVIS